MLLCNYTIKHTAQSRTKTQTLCGQHINMTTFNVHYVGTAVPMFNQPPCHKAIWGGGSTGPHIYLGTRQTRVVAFPLQPLHPKYHMNTKLGGPQRDPRSCGDHKNLFLCQNFNHSSLVMQPTTQLLQ